jgi:hypothetical protein
LAGVGMEGTTAAVERRPLLRGTLSEARGICWRWAGGANGRGHEPTGREALVRAIGDAAAKVGPAPGRRALD